MENWTDSSELPFEKPPLARFLGDYNDLLAGLVAADFSFRTLSSATLNRLEAQTHFFERLEKRVQIAARLRREPGLKVRLTGDDAFLTPILAREFPGRVQGGDPLRRKALLFPLKWAFHLGNTLLVTLAARLFARPAPGADAVLRTYFDFRCRDKDGRLREEYFGPLVPDLAAHSRLLVVYKLLHRGDLPLYLKLRKNAPFEHCLAEGFLGLGGALRAYFGYLFSAVRLKGAVLYGGADVRDLLQRALWDDYFSFRGLVVHLEREIALGILRSAPRRIYLPYENQTWEKVYPYVRDRLGLASIKIVGFQHTGLSYKLLNYFPSARETRLPVFPDRIVTVGRVIADVLRREAHYPSEIVEGAALRHHKLFAGGVRVTPPSAEPRRAVVYAFSYDLSKYGAILRSLIDVFGRSGINVFLRIHPDYREREVVADLGVALPANFVLAQTIPWDRVYAQADCVLYDDNSIGLEGMLHGVKTFMLDVGEPIYRCDRLFGFEEWPASLDAAGLARLRDDLEAGRYSKTFDAARVEAYLRAYFNPYSRERSFTAYSE